MEVMLMCFFRRKKKKEKALKEAQEREKTLEKKEAEKVKTPQEEVAPKTVKEKATTTKPELQAEEKISQKEKEKEESSKFAYHISQVKDSKSEFYKMWRVRRSGSKKVIKHFKTQKEAIDEAKKYGQDNEDASIVIHGRDGKIRRQKY
ncbi:MAG: DUF2188 domain-containing protein [Acholeplasmataceae bacterium]|nr:DUF2188 domain-containing protein [Acholeplasmataceae bacterium]